MSPTALALALALVVLSAAPPDPAEGEAIAAVEKLRGKAAVDPKLDAAARVAVTLEVGTDPALVAVGKLPNVGAVTVNDAGKCTERGYAALKELPDLQQLVLSNAKDPAVAVVGTIRTLEVLYLGGSRLTDAGLAGFKKLSHLRVLDLLDTRVTDAGLAHLTGLAALEELNLSGTKVTDAGLVPLAGLKKLNLVRLNQTAVTRAGVAKLEAALPKATVRW